MTIQLTRPSTTPTDPTIFSTQIHGAVLVPACTLTDQVILGIHHVTEQLTLRASWELRLESESFTGQHGSRKTGLLAP